MKHLLILSLILFFTPVSAAQVAIVTGASRGIGLGIADHLAQEGYVVYAGSRSSSSLERLKQAQEKSPNNLHIIELDVTDQKTIDSAVRRIIAKEGHIDVLVNNAGIGIIGSVENVTVEEAHQVYDVNVYGVMRMMQAVLPYMRAQRSGRIIQISSRSGFRPLPVTSVYAGSKFALEGMSEAYASLAQAWNIKISLIEPGPVKIEEPFTWYGLHLSKDEDPYAEIFESTQFWDPSHNQTPHEIALVVQEAIEAKNPLLRYQTSPHVKAHAAQRFVDPTGLKGVQEMIDLMKKN